MVTKREALEEQTPANLQKIADRLGIRVSTGLSGALTQAVFGPVKPSRRQYVETLANSNLVTLEDIDRILHTHYARLPDETRGMGYTQKAGGTLSGLFMQPRSETRVDRFPNLESLVRHILDRYVTKSDLQKICQQLGLPGTGNKPDLEVRVLGDPSLTNSVVVNYVNRDDMRKLCVDLKLPTTGTRGDMESRVMGVMARLPKPHPNMPIRDTLQYSSVPRPSHAVAYAGPAQEPQSMPSVASPEPELQPEPLVDSVPPPPPESPAPMPSASVPARPGLDSVVKFIETWRPTKPYEKEEGYTVELDTRLRTSFGDNCVKNELHILDGRIDIEAMGIGVELKLPTNKAMLQRLQSQARGYRKHYGPNLVIVIITGKAKLQDILATKADLEEDGIRVLVKSG